MTRLSREDRLEQLLSCDLPFWRQGIRLAGMDEVGRGPLAGCVTAACVVMPSDSRILWVDDSKKLSPSRREKVYEEIVRTARFVGIGRVEAEEIDRINILQATMKAMRQAANGAGAGIYLVDAVQHLGLDGEERALIHGDALSYSIAAASIVAKVVRDREMEELDKRFPMYGFAKNKGYGTAEHIQALREYGPSPIHRRSFIGRLLSKEA